MIPTAIRAATEAMVRVASWMDILSRRPCTLLRGMRKNDACSGTRATHLLRTINLGAGIRAAVIPALTGFQLAPTFIGQISGFHPDIASPISTLNTRCEAKRSTLSRHAHATMYVDPRGSLAKQGPTRLYSTRLYTPTIRHPYR